MKISFWKHHPISDQTGITLAQEAIDFQEKHQFNFLKLTPAGNWLSMIYGIKDELWENDSVGRRKITEFSIKTVSDFYTLNSITFKEPIVIEILEAIKICSTKVSVPVYATVFCPTSQLIQICGIDLFKSAIIEEPKAIFHALEIITENTIQVLEKVKDKGARGLYFVSQHMVDSILSREIYQQFGQSFDGKCLDFASIHFEDILFHLHGDDCYACIKENIPNLTLHCSINQEATNNSKTIQNIGYPVLYGLSSTELEKVNSSKDCLDLLHKFDIKDTLTCDCVLPLNFPEDKISLWKRSIHTLDF